MHMVTPFHLWKDTSSTMFCSIARHSSWSCPIAVSPPRTLHGSKFIAYASHVDNPDHVPRFLAHLSASAGLKRASHLMYAYCTSISSGSHDGGERGAGARLERLLELRCEQSVVVLVARWYGGTKLGSERWRCISNVAKQALDQIKPSRE